MSEDFERITLNGIEEYFDKWSKNGVKRVRGYYKGAGKTYRYLDKYIVFTIPDEKVCFYEIFTQDYTVLPKGLLNFAFNINEEEK